MVSVPPGLALASQGWGQFFSIFDDFFALRGGPDPDSEAEGGTVPPVLTYDQECNINLENIYFFYFNFL